jgi:hypothetical protein
MSDYYWGELPKDFTFDGPICGATTKVGKTDWVCHRLDCDGHHYYRRSG